MNAGLSFALGVLGGISLSAVLLALLVSIASGTPEMALSSIAACMRGFASKLGSLHVIVSVKGEQVAVSLEQIASAIECAELARGGEASEGGRGSGVGGRPEGAGKEPNPSPPAARSPQSARRDLH